MKRLLSVAILLLAVAAAVFSAAAAPNQFHRFDSDDAAPSNSTATLTSDKLDYHPGEVVTLTGSGWKPGEKITIVMVVDPWTHEPVTITAEADASGNLTNKSYVVQLSDSGVTFTVTATGDRGYGARTTFTDSSATTVTITGNGTVTDNQGPIINCVGTNGTTTGTCTHTYGFLTGVTLTATPAAGYIFSSWTNTGSQTCTPSGNTCSFTGTFAANTVTVKATFVAVPTIAKAFSPTTIAVGGTSTLTLTMTNPSTTSSQTSVAVSDSLPSGVQVASTPNATTSGCGTPTWSPGAGATTLTFSGGTIAASGTCTASVNVTATNSGSKVNTTGAVSSSNGTGGTATATLTVLAVPTITKSFAPSTISVTGTSTMTVTITNPNTGTAITGVTVSDTFPAGMSVSGAALATTCSGGLTGGGIGATSFSVNASTIAASGSCNVTGNVTESTTGTATNTTGNVSSTNAGTGGTASATLTVNAIAAPTITKSFGSASMAQNTGTSTMTVTITNPAANTVALTGVTVSDTFPGGMTVSTALTTTCSGGLTGGGVGANTFSLNASTINTNSSCTITGSVSSITAGVRTNTTGAVTSTNGGGAATASASIAVEVPPTITKSFAPTSGIATGASSLMTLTITNPTGTNTVSLTGITVTDTFPAGLVVQTPSGANNTCGGTFTANAGAGSVSLGGAGGTVAVGASCTLTVNVTSATAATYNNTTGAVSSTNGGTGTTSNTASVTFTAPPTITKNFAPSTIPLNGTSTLTLTITEPGTDTGAMNGITVSDTFPAGIQVAATPNATNTCGGTFAPAAGNTTISLTNGSISTPGSSCAVSVSVSATTGGSKSNTTGQVSSTNDGTGGTANAVLTVVAPPTITKAFGSSATGIPVGGTSTMTITITNPAANTVALTGVTVSDNFPSGMTVSTALTTTCSGGLAGTGGVGSNTFTLSSSTIAVGANCTITGSVTDNTAGSAVNTTSAVTSTNGGAGLTATATLPVNLAPTVAKSFNPTSIAPGGTSTLTLTFTNPATNTVALSGLTISDTYPSGLTNSGTPNRTNTCGGTSTGAANGNTLALTNAANTIPVGGSCTLSITVTAATGGSYVNTTGNVSSANGGTDGSATATLAVNVAPTITKGFAPPTIAIGGISTLTLTLTNPPANTVALSGVAVSDTFPAGMTVAGTPAATNSCGGTFTANANAGNISLTGGTIAVNSSCTVTVHVTGTTAGNKSNTTGTVSATNGGTGGTANATLTVVAPPTITKVFNPTSTQINTTSTFTLTITNPAANTVAESGVAVSDTFPIGLVVAASPNATNTCGGTFTAGAGAGTISLSGGTINTGTSCAVSVSVTSAITGTFNNTTGTVSSTNGGTGLTASATLTVFGLPTQLVFGVQPSNTQAGSTITPAITVKVEDVSGNVVISGTGSNASVTMSIGTNPGPGVLSGTTTVTAAAGTATFSTLSISAQGNGYTLVANSTGLTPATSNTFNITAPQATYIQPFNSGHGWTYTQLSCSVGIIGNCANSAAATGANCASSPCVDASTFAGLQTGASQSGYFQSPIGSYTWATLGVPPNSTVTTIQGGWSDLAGGALNSCTTGTTAGIQIFDSTNTTEITNQSVAPLDQVAGDTSVTVHNLGPAVTVNPGFQATSTGITLRFNLNVDSASFLGTCTLYGDTFQLLISWTVGSPANGRRGQVVIGWNKQPDGTIGQAWAYNVELSGDAAVPLTLADLKLLPNGRSGFDLDLSALEGKGRRVTTQVKE